MRTFRLVTRIEYVPGKSNVVADALSNDANEIFFFFFFFFFFIGSFFFFKHDLKKTLKTFFFKNVFFFKYLFF